MAGTLVISTLSDGTNSTSSTNCIQGSAKAWVNFNGSGGAITRAYNISSITVLGTGSYTVNFTSAMADATYVITATTGSNGGAWVTTQTNCDGYSYVAPTASSFRLQTPEGNFASMQNSPSVYVAVFR